MVTGANRGIGKQIVRDLHEMNHMVFLGSRDHENGLKAAAEMDLPEQQVIELDVRSEESVGRALAQIGQLDVVVNNAAVWIDNRNLVQANIDEIKQLMEVNFYGPMRMNVAAIPLLKKSMYGRIINISSEMGELANLDGNYAAYRLSKAGLNAQTIMLSRELGDRVKVASMCPGWVHTDMGGPSAPRTPKQGAETAVWLSTDDSWSTGKFWRDKKEINF